MNKGTATKEKIFNELVRTVFGYVPEQCPRLNTAEKNRSQLREAELLKQDLRSLCVKHGFVLDGSYTAPKTLHRYEKDFRKLYSKITEDINTSAQIMQPQKPKRTGPKKLVNEGEGKAFLFMLSVCRKTKTVGLFRKFFEGQFSNYDSAYTDSEWAKQFRKILPQLDTEVEKETAEFINKIYCKELT